MQSVGDRDSAIEYLRTIWLNKVRGHRARASSNQKSNQDLEFSGNNGFATIALDLYSQRQAKFYISYRKLLIS